MAEQREYEGAKAVWMGCVGCRVGCVGWLGHQRWLTAASSCSCAGHSFSTVRVLPPGFCFDCGVYAKVDLVRLSSVPGQKSPVTK
jgi:hypothetical protein